MHPSPGPQERNESGPRHSGRLEKTQTEEGSGNIPGLFFTLFPLRWTDPSCEEPIDNVPNISPSQERNVAAAKIQAHVRNFLKRRRARKQSRAAVRLQAAWRGYAARNTATLIRKANLWALQTASATAIQVCSCFCRQTRTLTT